MKVKSVRVPAPYTLMKHQNDYREWIAREDITHPACFMEMRLRKCLSNIRTVRYWCEWSHVWEDSERKLYPILVVCPSAVMAEWEKDLRREREYCVTIGGLPYNKRIQTCVDEAFDDTGVAEGRVWILINYESLLYTPGLVTLSWFTVILDESTIIKNPKAKISKLCVKGFRDVEHRVILTGLPSPEGPLDLFQQFAFLHGSFMGCKNFYEYRNRYFRVSWDGWQPVRGALAKIKAEVHCLSFVLTRSEAGMGSVKVFETRQVKMTSEQRRIYDEAEKDFCTYVEYRGKTRRVETDHVISQRIWLSSICGGCDAYGQFIWDTKAKELLHLLKGEIKDQPVVVWCRFTTEIEGLFKYLTKAGITCRTLTGADSRDQKNEKQKWFRNSSVKNRVIICQEQKVAEYGVDMSSASVAIYYSLVYSGQTISQTQDRIVDVDKKEPLLYIFLAMVDSVDVDAIEVGTGKVTDAKLFMKKVDAGILARYGSKRNRS